MRQVIWVTSYGVSEIARGTTCENHLSIAPYNLDMSSVGYVRVMEVEVSDLLLPTRSAVIPAVVQELRAREQSLMEDTEVKLTEIRRLVANMLCLENRYDPSTPE